MCNKFSFFFLMVLSLNVFSNPQKIPTNIQVPMTFSTLFETGGVFSDQGTLYRVKNPAALKKCFESNSSSLRKHGITVCKIGKFIPSINIASTCLEKALGITSIPSMVESGIATYGQFEILSGEQINAGEYRPFLSPNVKKVPEDHLSHYYVVLRSFTPTGPLTGWTYSLYKPKAPAYYNRCPIELEIVKDLS